MTCSTSEVAVCCSSASDSSRVRACTSSNSRTFSIAITAWSAKVVDQFDLLVGERPHVCVASDDQDADRHSLAQQRDAEQRALMRRGSLVGPAMVYSGSAEHIGDMDGAGLQRSRARTIEPRSGVGWCAR